jgi:hypothetical protein
MATVAFIKSGKLRELLQAVDPQNTMYVKVLSSARLALGPDPLNPSAIVDLSKEKVLPFAEEAIKASPLPEDPATNGNVGAHYWKRPRRGGDYWFELKGKREEYHSLKDVLAAGLLALEEDSPGTFEKLTQIKPRSRRIVARDPKLLFEKEHLANGYAERLSPEWVFGTNNSAAETNSWLERACSCAGLKWGVDFKTNIGPTIDDL